jgi:cephalosporin hydroxylase
MASLDGPIHLTRFSGKKFRIRWPSSPTVTASASAETIRHADLQSWPRPWDVADADHSYETSIAVLDFVDPRLEPGGRIVVEDGKLSDLYPKRDPD